MRPAADISRIAGPLTEIGPHNSFPPLIHKGIMETGLMAKKKTAAPTKAMTKTEILAALAEGTGLSKNEISSVFTELGTLIGKKLGTRPRRVQHPWSDESQSDSQTSHQGSQGNQPVHKRRADVQSQASSQRRQSIATERPEGHGLNVVR